MVHTDLNPWWVTAHFVTALALIACVVYVAAASVPVPEPAPDRTTAPGFARLAMWSAGVTGALLLVGTYVRARGPRVGLAFRDWPLMDGRLVPALVREVLAGTLKTQKDIKARVREWQADYLRA